MKYFRKTTRFRRRYNTSFKRKYIRRPFRPGSKMFFKKQRRYPKPEIKWALNNTEPTLVAANQKETFNVTPLQMSDGSGIGQRIGRQIKIRKVVTRVRITAQDDQTADTNRADIVTRMIYWSAKRPQVTCEAYMEALGFNSHVDWNMVHVYKDTFVKVGFPRYVFTAASTNLESNPVWPTEWVRKYTFSFPRTAEFSSLTTDLVSFDVNKDVMYVTFINPAQCAIAYEQHCKMTYIDV